MRIKRLLETNTMLVVFVAGVIVAILSEYDLAFSTPSNRIFFPVFEFVYPWSVWFLLFFFVTSIGSLGYAAARFFLRANVDMNSLENVATTPDRNVVFMTIILATLFAIPYIITRSQYSLPGGDTVAYIGMANQFLHFGIGWSLLNDSRPFVDMAFALITLGVSVFGFGIEATYLISASVLMLSSIVLMIASSILLLRRNGFDKLTVFVALLLTLASVQTFQLNGGTYANSLAFSLLYLSVYLLDKALFTQGVRQLVLLASLGVLAALTHIQTFGLSSLVLLFSALAISWKLPRVEAKKQLTKVITFLVIEVIVLSPFISLALFDTRYFGAFSTYLGNVRGRYFVAFPGLISPTPPIAFDRTALYSLAVQYGDLPVFLALAASFLALAFRFRKEKCLRTDVYALVWSAMAVIGSAFAYGLSILIANPTFDGPLLARRLLYLLPLPLLYSMTTDFLRRFHL